ncbi:MAG: aldolase/citrate lyase family protein [Nitrososphaerota archaeon]
MFKNKVKRLLHEGKVAIGAWVTINSTDVIEALSRVGLDWLLFDMEHGSLEVSDIQRLLPATNGTDTVPLVRIPWNDFVIIKRVLDIGAYGIMVPWVNTRENVEAVVKAVMYPPQGIRGFGPRRAVYYGLEPSNEYFKSASDEILVVVQIETEDAINNIDEILSVKGVDVAFIGPYDLSANLGIFGDFEHPKFKSAIDKVLNSCKRKGVAPGMAALSVDDAMNALKMGFKFVSIGYDIFDLTRAYRSNIEKVRRYLSFLT